jgi:hypothetical protein
MANVEWILGSILSLSGWRLDILLVRVTRFARVLFVGIAYAVSPPAPRLVSPDVRMDARTVIDTVGYAVEETDERADVLTDCAFELAA